MGRSLSSRIFIALFVGLLIGTLIQYVIPTNVLTHDYVVSLATGVGTMFVSLIKLLVVPLVFVSIVYGITELKDINAFGRLGSKTFGLYLANTVLAIIVSLTVVMILQPGAGVTLALGEEAMALKMTETPDIGQILVNIVPSNPIQAFANGDMLQIIFMAIITGLAIKALDHKGGPAIRAFKVANDVMMKLITLVMSLAPYGVFALMIQLGATMESETLFAVAGYVALVVALLCLWIFVVYPLAVWMFTGIKPGEFRRKTREQVLFSLSTASSNATIPVTMRTLTDKLGVSRSVAGFGVPLGATMNMSGASIYIVVAVAFAANAFGNPIQVGDLFTIGFTVLLLSVGAGGVPGGGVVMIGVLLHQLGLPIEALAIIAAVDRVNDMFCTSANVVGDTAVNTIVAHSEGEFNKAGAAAEVEEEVAGQRETA